MGHNYLMNQAERFHHNLVRKVAFRLADTKGYESVVTNIEYKRRGYCGEIDIQTLRNGHIHRYEIKGHHGRGQLLKAKHQLQRERAAFPEDNAKLIYIAQRFDGSLRVRRVR